MRVLELIVAALIVPLAASSALGSTLAVEMASREGPTVAPTYVGRTITQARGNAGTVELLGTISLSEPSSLEMIRRALAQRDDPTNSRNEREPSSTLVLFSGIRKMDRRRVRVTWVARSAGQNGGTLTAAISETKQPKRR